MCEGKLKSYRDLEDIPDRRTLARPRSRWKDNDKMDLQELGLEGLV